MDVSNVGIVLVLLLLIFILWSYRRYELNKIKKKYNSADIYLKSGISKDQEFSNLHQPVEKIENGNGCLTGLFGVRNCFFLNDGELPNGSGAEDL